MKSSKRIAALLCALLLLLLFGCTPYSSDRMATEDRVTCYLSNAFGSGAFVSAVSWNGDLNDTDIYIPASCGGQKVVALGGFMGTGVPTPMLLTPEDETKGGGLHEGAVPVTFTVYFGANIQKIYQITGYGDLPAEQNGELIFVRPNFYMVCAEENETFYTRDGRVFKKEDDSLVTGIAYWDEAAEPAGI